MTNDSSPATPSEETPLLEVKEVKARSSAPKKKVRIRTAEAASKPISGWPWSTVIMLMLPCSFFVTVLTTAVLQNNRGTCSFREKHQQPREASMVVLGHTIRAEKKSDKNVASPKAPTFLLYQPILAGDFGGFHEFSVAHSDRSLNYESRPFEQVMLDLSRLLKLSYQADHVAIIPGSGTFGMESVARQFVHGGYNNNNNNNENVLVLSNGHFGHRWVEILEMGQITKSHSLLTARPVPQIDEEDQRTVQYAPPPLEEVVAFIQQNRPKVLFATHVETSTGILLPTAYIQSLAQAVHEYNQGGILVVDAIASGAIFLNMKDLGIDVLIASPQKDWTSPPGVALVHLSQRAYQIMLDDSDRLHYTETSFSLSLRQWIRVMHAYENGSSAYYTTPPTDMLRQMQETSLEILQLGLDRAQERQWELGQRARQQQQQHRRLVSVAAPGFQSPSVLVYYCHKAATLVQALQQPPWNLHVAHGLSPWMLPQESPNNSFRIGLFGVDKLKNVNATLKTLQEALDAILQQPELAAC